MKKQTILLALILGLFTIPIIEIRAASPGKANIVMIGKLGSVEGTNNIALSGDGKYILAHTRNSDPVGNVSLLEIPDSFSTEAVVKWSINEPHAGYMLINSDGSGIVYGDFDTNTIYRLSDASITPIWELSTPTNLEILYMSDNGEYVIYSYHDGTRHLICVSGVDKSLLWSHDIQTEIPYAVDISNSGHAVVTLSNNTIHYYDSEGLVWQRDELVSYKVSITNDGSFVLVSPQFVTDNLTLYNGAGTKVWEVEDQWAASGFDIAKDSSEIIAGSVLSSENHIYGFTTESEVPVWSIPTERAYSQASISSNGKIGIIVGTDQTLQILDMTTGESIATHYPGDFVNKVEISDDGTVAAILVGRDTIIVYSLTPAQDFLAQFIGGFTDLDNIYSLGASVFVGLLLGGLIFGLGKKKR